MIRTIFAATILVGLLSPAVRSESISVSSSYAVDPVTETRRDAVIRGRVEGEVGGFYGGIRAETLPKPDDVGAVAVYLGMRPRLGDVSMDLAWTRNVEADCCGALAVDVSRNVGESGRVAARVRFDATGDSAETEARASVRVYSGTRLAGGIGTRVDGDSAQLGFDVGLSRALADLCTLDLRYRDAASGAPRAEMLLKARF